MTSFFILYPKSTNGYTFTNNKLLLRVERYLIFDLIDLTTKV